MAAPTGTPQRPRENSSKNAKTRKRSGLTPRFRRRTFALPQQGLRSVQGSRRTGFGRSEGTGDCRKTVSRVGRDFGPGRPAGKAERPERHPEELRLRRESVRQSAQRVAGKPAAHWVDAGPPPARGRGLQPGNRPKGLGPAGDRTNRRPPSGGDPEGASVPEGAGEATPERPSFGSTEREGVTERTPRTTGRSGSQGPKRLVGNNPERATPRRSSLGVFPFRGLLSSVSDRAAAPGHRLAAAQVRSGITSAAKRSKPPVSAAASGKYEIT